VIWKGRGAYGATGVKKVRMVGSAVRKATSISIREKEKKAKRASHAWDTSVTKTERGGEKRNPQGSAPGKE